MFPKVLRLRDHDQLADAARHHPLSNNCIQRALTAVTCELLLVNFDYFGDIMLI